MTATVFHVVARDEKGRRLVDTPQWPDDYELVCTVQTEDLNEAFTKTQHIDRPWWENAGVDYAKHTRSTSVGDVVRIKDKHYLCEPFGWSPFDP